MKEIRNKDFQQVTMLIDLHNSIINQLEDMGYDIGDEYDGRIEIITKKIGKKTKIYIETSF